MTHGERSADEKQVDGFLRLVQVVERSSSCFSKCVKEHGSASKTEIIFMEHGPTRPRLRVEGVSYGEREGRRSVVREEGL